MIYILKNVFSYETHAKKFLKINKYNYNYIYLFLRIFSHLIKTIKIINYVNNNFSEYVIVLKNNLNDLTCSDNLNLLTKTTRFSLFYVLQNAVTELIKFILSILRTITNLDVV